jgi:hypothetical protein
LIPPNPYESPRAAGGAERSFRVARYRSRWQAVRGEAWRGAKFGFKTNLAIWGGCVLLWIVAAIVIFLITGRTPWETRDLPDPFVLLKWLGVGALGVLGGSIIFGAVPGASIVGLAGAIRWRRVDENSGFIIEEVSHVPR